MDPGQFAFVSPIIIIYYNQINNVESMDDYDHLCKILSISYMDLNYLSLIYTNIEQI